MSWLLCKPSNRKHDNKNDEKNKQLRDSMKQHGIMYTTDPNIVKWNYHKDTKTFEWLFRRYTGKEMDLDANPITPADLRIFKSGIKEFSRDLGKQGTLRERVSSFFKVPGATMRKLPELKRYQDDLIAESSFFRRYQIENQHHSKIVADNWEVLAAEIGGKNLPKEFRALEKKMDVNLSIKTPNAEQKAERNALKQQWTRLLEKGAVPVLRDIQEVINGADIDTLPGYTQGQKSMLKEIDSSMMKIRQNGVKIMTSALRKVIETAKMVDAREGSTRNLHNIMKELSSAIKHIEFQGKKDIEGGKVPYNKMVADTDMEVLGFTKGETIYFKKYMPHKLLGMVKLIKDGHRMMLNTEGKTSEQQSLDWDNFRTNVESAMSRSPFPNPYFSKDPLFFLRQYNHEIAQFNYQAHLENTFRKQVSHLMDMSEKAVNENDRQLERASEALITQMHEMKHSLIGIDPKSDSALNQMSRLLTSVQYFRLMGGNVRSAARNGTQRLYEFVHFGFKATKDAGKWYKDNPDKKSGMEKQAKAHGILWHSGGQGKRTRDALSVETGARGAIEVSQVPQGMRVDSDGVLRMSEGAEIGKKVTEAAAKTADMFGTFHRRVENWNRKGTFETAYSLSKMNLERASDAWVSKQMGVSLDRLRGKGGAGKREAWEQRKAGNVAYNAVVDLHFEYAKWAKSKALKGPAGQVVGQFLHYRFSLFDLMSRWWKDGKRSILAGDFNREESWRLYRLGLIQSMVSGTSLAMGLNIGALVQNDVVETAEQLWMLMSADRDNPDEMKELERKTYRQGVTSFAGPTVSHGIQFGEWMNWWSTDHNGIPRSPYQYTVDTGDSYKRKQRWKGRSLINSELARASTYSIPVLAEQGIWDFAQLESGTYLTKENRKTRKRAGRLFRDYVPEKIRNLRPFADVTLAQSKLPNVLRPKRAGAVAGLNKRPGLKVSPYEVSRVLGSLDYIKGKATPGSILETIRS
jgi:hypothetical protein